jgi:hypothetical protein
MRWGILLLAVASITAGLAPSARAADATVGAPADAEPVQQQGCAITGCILTGRDLVPADGRIVSWRAAGDGDGVRLRVLRPNADGSLTPVGTSAPETIAGLPTTFATDLPVARGDRIGVEVPGGGSGPSITPVALAGTAIPAPVVSYAALPGGAFDYLPLTADGAAAHVLGSVTSDVQLLVAATVRTPDPPAAAPAPAQRAEAKHTRRHHRRHRTHHRRKRRR